MIAINALLALKEGRREKGRIRARSSALSPFL